jgi:hypothetical protein
MHAHEGHAEQQLARHTEDAERRQMNPHPTLALALALAAR